MNPLRNRLHNQPLRPFALALALTLVTAALAAQSPALKPYGYPADGFTASFPSEPAMYKQSVPTAAGSFELHSYVAQDGAAALIVAVCDYGATAASADPDVILQGAKTGALTNTKAHLLGESKIALGANHGIAFEGETDTMHLSVRLYLSGGVLYRRCQLSRFLQTHPAARQIEFADFTTDPAAAGGRSDERRNPCQPSCSISRPACCRDRPWCAGAGVEGVQLSRRWFFRLVPRRA
jgi:hypothetical protein